MVHDHSELPLDPDLPRGDGSPIRELPLHLTPAALGCVALGGTLGTAARYAVALTVPTLASWPLATLAVNLAGAFILGALLEALARRGPDVGRRRRLRLLAGTGFCGGFTTYSTLAVEIEQLWQSRTTGVAISYAVVTVVAGFLATTLGIWLATRRTPSPT